jgi:hypothetical protein
MSGHMGIGRRVGGAMIDGPVTSTSRSGSMRPEFGRTQYLQEKEDISFACPSRPGIQRGSGIVLLRRRRLNLESNGRRVRVPDLQSLGHLNSERAYTQQHSLLV